MTSPLSVSDIVVSFGGNHVLTGLDLEVHRRFTGLIGPNGAGKTTLFNVISGYVAPTRGSVSIAGRDVAGLGQVGVARLGVGRTFQTPKLIGDLSVVENVMIGLDGRSSLVAQFSEALVSRAPGRAKRTRALEVLSEFSLADVAHVEAGSLPLGSQKIVEVCRALVNDPSLLLLDEPAAGLGRDDVEQLVEPLRRWVDGHDVSVVIIEHDLELVNNLCEDVAVLHLGSIISRGTPAECMSDPQVVEAYLGAGFAQRS